MVVILRNSVNSVKVTASEFSRLSLPFFLLEFDRDFAGEQSRKYYYTGQDISPTPSQLNIFEIEESDEGGDFANGFENESIKLPSGSYTLNIYEAEEIPESISDTTGEIIARYMVRVEATNEINNIYK